MAVCAFDLPPIEATEPAECIVAAGRLRLGFGTAIVGMSGEVSIVAACDGSVIGPSFGVVWVTIVAMLPSSSSVAAGGGGLDESGFTRQWEHLINSNTPESRKKDQSDPAHAAGAPASGFFSL
jgi:hypothetical protein